MSGAAITFMLMEHVSILCFDSEPPRTLFCGRNGLKPIPSQNTKTSLLRLVFSCFYYWPSNHHMWKGRGSPSTNTTLTSVKSTAKHRGGQASVVQFCILLLMTFFSIVDIRMTSICGISTSYLCLKAYMKIM